MPTRTKPIHDVRLKRFPGANLDQAARRRIINILGIAKCDADEALRIIETARSEGLGRMQWEQIRPLPANFRAEFSAAVAAVTKAAKQVSKLTPHARALLRGTRGEGCAAEVTFLTAARALQERIGEVEKDLQRWEQDELRPTMPGDNPSSGGARKHRIKNARELEQSSLARWSIELALKEPGLSEEERDILIQAIPMRTAMIQVYKRWAAKPDDAALLKKFLQAAESGLNAGTRRPRND